MPTFPALGEVVGGYRIEELIGRGGMSVVYLAEQLALGRKVALKLLSPELSEDEEFRQRFVRESRLAGGLEHPNIIPVHEAGDVEGLLFIAMRYVQGSDLKALLQREGQLSLQRTIDIIAQAASALDAAHARGLVHRDVKPGNLLVASGEGPESSEHIYLSDFGLTKKTDSKSRMTSTGQFVGTLDYVAPEQIQGKDVSGRTDLYSLACVACECLTGKAPYERDSEVAVMYAHLQDPPPKPTESRSDLPPAIDAVMERAMAKDPAQRYETCREMIGAMRATLDAGISAPAPQRAPRVRRKKRPEPEASSGPRSSPATVPTPVAASVGSDEITRPAIDRPRADTKESTRPARGVNLKLAALVAIPILAIAAFVMSRGGDDPEREQNNNPGVVSGGSTSPTAGGEDPAPTELPGRIAFLEETERGSERFFVAVASPPDARPEEVPGTAGFDWRNRRADWQPNGDLVAFAHPTSDNELDLVVIDTSTNEVVDQLEVDGAQGSVSISPDGQKLAFSQTVDSNMDVYVWDRSTDETTRLTTNPGDDDSPEWSPDGTHIVFEREATNGNDIYIMDVDGSDLQRITDTPNINEKLPEFHPTDDTLVVYHQQESGQDFGIYVHDTDEPMIDSGVKVIDTPAFEMRPTWSPDGEFIAFDSDTNGNLDVFVIPFQGVDDSPAPRDAIQITDGPHDEQSPAWGGAS